MTSCSKTPYHDAFFPITFIPGSGVPKTDVIIEGTSYSLIVDLGACLDLSLRADILENLQKEPLESTYSIDIKGNRFLENTYRLPEIRIRNMKIKTPEVHEENPSFLVEGSSIYDTSGQSPNEQLAQKQGRIGRGILGLSNLFMDFQNSVMFACSDLYKRKKEGYDIRKLQPVPFKVLSEGIIFTANTDLGPRRFLLDTGATHSFLKPSLAKNISSVDLYPGLPCYHSSTFVLGGKDFGAIDLILFEIAPSLGDFDGIIGMDFLKEHIVYLDFAKKEALIGKSLKCMLNPHLLGVTYDQ